MRVPSRIPLHRLLLAAALLITAATYLQSAAFDFVYDDFGQIVYNPKIQSWRLAVSYFTSHVWSQDNDLALYYRPVYMLWLRTNHAFFGLNPLYWHLTAVSLHLAVCLLLYLFVRRLTQDQWVGVVSVLLFGLHPAHVESVAWVSGTTESLFSALLLGSLLCYWKHRDSRQPLVSSWLSVSLILAFLATLTKETALILPALVFSYEWIFGETGLPLRTRLGKGLRAAGPFLMVALSFLVMRALALHSITPPAAKTGRLFILLAWPKAIAFYLAHLLFPTRLSVFYELFSISHPSFGNFVLPALFMSIGAAVLFYGSRRSRVFAYLAVWCGVLLVPTLNVTLWENVENVHDRYLYLASAAVCIMLAMVLSRLKQLEYTKTAAGVLVSLAGMYCFITVHELQPWRSDYDLAERGVSNAPNDPVATQLLGNALIKQGRIRDAIGPLVASLEVNPANVTTLCSLAYCYQELHALQLAEECLGKALGVRPLEPRAHMLLGLVRTQQGRLDEAEAELRRAIALERVPGTIVSLHYYLGNILHTKGDVQGAVREYQLESRNDPAIDPAAGLARQRLQEPIPLWEPEARP